MVSFLQRLETKLQPYFGILLLLGLLILLRLPNFSEPYWYGDEGIYLVIGIALRGGERLYAEIIDHKTPLIYYLAMTGTQFWFRTLLLGWMLTTTVAFYALARKIVSTPWSLFGTLIFILLTTFPWMEGNIPNGELFVMGFVLVGAAILSYTTFFKQYLSDQAHHRLSVKDITLLFITGLLLSLGILTKVPALFDALAIMSLAWFSLTRQFSLRQLFQLKTWLTPIAIGFVLTVGIAIPILISIVYFISRGSGQDYLNFGLLYNFHYASNWTLPFTQAWLQWSFTLLGKATFMVVGLGIITIARKWLSPAFQWIAAWSIMALFASLLSNRPYPHYFLQLVPPLILLGVVAFDRLQTHSKQFGSWLQLVLATSIIGLTIKVMLLLGVGFYPTMSYYQRWFKLVTGEIDQPTYYQTFNGIMADNYRAANLISQSPDPYLFIWGTNPMLYALSQKIPTGRFTVAFHIKDLNTYQETLDSLKAKHPTFIVVMNEDANSFPEFSQYLIDGEYMPNGSFDHFTLWMRQ